MQWSDIPFDATKKTLRQFAGLWIVFFGGLALYWGPYKGYPTAGWILGAVALTMGPLGLVMPSLIRPIFVGWMVLAFPIGWLISRIVLGILYYGVFTPLSLIFRLQGRDALARRKRPEAASYWIAKPVITDVRRYYRQF